MKQSEDCGYVCFILGFIHFWVQCDKSIDYKQAKHIRANQARLFEYTAWKCGMNLMLH